MKLRGNFTIIVYIVPGKTYLGWPDLIEKISLLLTPALTEGIHLFDIFRKAILEASVLYYALALCIIGIPLWTMHLWENTIT